ncbi:LysR family transcriptional regulator [Halalkalibacter krulwichiae]|uniref:HTH-type transcriptional regulator GltC n=1 Tax=Halalkalibacter krulwichiae TaxID=199441 RepID=A0A1X9MGJ8_9BACI|nr:LysR family transcriptional regulator [Halalkalibacter krulwichiae]ARK32577.1 HTH-type transcriptional regulator GltC [Halalkalibacter krulwichiae]
MLPIDIKQIRCFLEVCKELSISRASSNLHLSQPALSKIIQAMEEELGVPLFNRSTRHLHITDEGKAIIPYAKRLLRQMEDLLKVAAELQHTHAGNVRFGLPPVIGSSFFPSIITAFKKQYPHIQLTIVEEGSRIIEQTLLDGHIDLGITILPLDTDQFDVIPIIERKLKLVLPINHPLANRESVALSQLRNDPFLMFSKGFSLYDRVRDACIQAGFEPTIIQESSQWDFMMEMVAADNGICILPETICVHADLTRCAVVHVTDPEIEWNLAIVRRKNSYLSTAMKTWIDFIRSSLGSDGALTVPGTTRNMSKDDQ